MALPYQQHLANLHRTTSSLDDYAAQLPRRPARAVTTSPTDDERPPRRSRRTSRAERDSRGDYFENRESPRRKPARSASKERRRRQREQRRAEDAEYDAKCRKRAARRRRQRHESAKIADDLDSSRRRRSETRHVETHRGENPARTPDGWDDDYEEDLEDEDVHFQVPSKQRTSSSSPIKQNTTTRTREMLRRGESESSYELLDEGRSHEAPRPTPYRLETETSTSYSNYNDAHDLEQPPLGYERPSKHQRTESWASSEDGHARDVDLERSDLGSKRYYSSLSKPGESWTSLEDGYGREESSRLKKKDRSRRQPSYIDELDFYKRGNMPDPHVQQRREQDKRRGGGGFCCGCMGWSRRRHYCVWGSLIAFLVILVIVIVAAVLATRNKFTYTPSYAQVNNTAAFTAGGATRNSVNDTNDGTGAGSDTYTYFEGDASKFPNQTEWVSFEDMWKNNLPVIQQSCGWLGYKTENTQSEIDDIYSAIQDRANASLVDHRYILAIIMQESHGCLHVESTKSSTGVKNPGLMQSHEGHSYNPSHKAKSILQMVQDGTQGTEHGDGLVQNLNMYANPYKAARGYNSGYIPASGDLSEAAGATACYVSDVANRLTGWVQADSKCPGDTDA